MIYHPTMSATRRPEHPAPPLIVLGGGGHARVLLELARRLDRHVLAVLDDKAALHGTTLDGIEIKGAIDQLGQQQAWDPDRHALLNAVGSAGLPRARQAVYERARAAGFAFQTLAHPAAVVADNAALGEGAQVLAGAVVGAGATVGDNALVNTHASLDHDAVLGPHGHLAPGATVCGSVRIGAGCTSARAQRSSRA